MGEPDVGEEFAELVHGRTEGNPFFVQQVLRVMVERGDVFRKEGKWDRKSVAEIEVPESIRSVIGQRLSRLIEEIQEVLRIASVLGQTSQFDDLLTMTQLDEAEQERALERASAAGLVQTADGDAYAFDHALTQQTLYAEIPARRRRRLHVAAAAAIERSSAPRDAELAWHFLQADDAERALPYSMRAGDAAMGVFAWSEAEMQYRTAAQLAQELGDAATEASAWQKLGDLLVSGGRHAEAVEALGHAAHAYSLGGNVDGEARAIAWIACTMYMAGAIAEGKAHLQHLLDAYPDAAASPALLFAAANLEIWDTFQSQRYTSLLDAAEQALAQAKRLGDARWVAQMTAARGFALRSNGRLEEAFAALETGWALAERTGDPQTRMWCAMCLAEGYLYFGKWADALDVLQKALIAAERIRNVSFMAHFHAHIGWALTYLGEWRAARERLEEAVAISRSMEQSWMSAHPYLQLSELAILEGSWDEAAMLLDEVNPIVQAIDDPQWREMAHFRQMRLDIARGNPDGVVARMAPYAESLDRGETVGVLFAQQGQPLAHAYLATGELDRAQRAVDEGVRVAVSAGYPPQQIPWLLLQALIHTRRGKWEDAERAFEEAAELPRNLSMPYDEAQALFEWGMMLLQAEQPERAREKLSEAVSTFTRLGARHDIERAAQALDALS